MPNSPEINLEYQTKTDLSLPFKGQLSVTNGGRDEDTNNHVKMVGSGMLAYDFRDGHQEDGLKLEDYVAFGKEVIAPGDGIISQVINGSIDCQPGERDRSVGVGNAVVIDHQNGEWSVLCHMQHNSIKVSVGDKVIQGDILGLCGNTGNTSEPHIHFHLQDAPQMHNANPLPAQFRKIKVNDQIKESYEPIRGEVVENV